MDFKRWAGFFSLILFFVLLVTNGHLFAQSRGKIIGRVTDKATGEPLLSANVHLVGTALGAATNLDGEYQIPAVPPGRYILRTTYISYEKDEKAVQVKPGQTESVDVELILSVLEGETVTITAQAEGQLHMCSGTRACS